MQKLTCRQRLEKAHTKIITTKELCALTGIIMCGKTVIEPDSAKCLTAATDGWNVYYGEAFMQTLTDPEFLFVVLHENFHKLYAHTRRFTKLNGYTDQRKANMAMDYVINLQIQEMLGAASKLISVPALVLIDAKYRGMTTKQVYNLLPDNGGGNSMDEHMQPGEGEGSGKELSAAEQLARARAIEHAVKQGAMLSEKMTGKKSRLNDMVESRADWRELLREFMVGNVRHGDESTWRRPSRRGLAMDKYMPSTYSETLGDVVIGIDTSGSIGGPELAQFLGELSALCSMTNPERVHLLYWDTEVAGAEEYAQGGYDGIATSTKPKGGGGTYPVCVLRYLLEKNITPQVVVMLTDGYIGEWPSFGVPTLWGITTRSITSPVGISVYIGE